MGKKIRTDNSIIEIKLAFWGATKNLYLLEKILVHIENMPIYQYCNYLSQVALCIELGLKTIIVNTDDFDQIHCLDKLFFKSPEAFQKVFKSLFPDDELFNSNISSIKNIFKDFRYMELDSTLKEYLDESIINSDKTINFKNAFNLQNVQFLHILLDNIKEYEKNIREETLKYMTDLDFSNNDIINQYSKLLKKVTVTSTTESSLDYLTVKIENGFSIKKQFIAYFDILGYKNDLLHDDEIRKNELLNLISSSINLLKQIIEMFKTADDKIDINLKAFSDNFLLCTEKDYIALLEIVGCMQAALFSFNTSIRGALCYDELFFSKEFVFGKGLINAYFIENEISVFPRILVDNSFLTGIENNINQNGQENINSYPVLKNIEDYFYIDIDNNKYLNYLGVMKKYKEYEEEYGGLVNFHELLDSHIKYININLNSGDMRVEQKIQWIKSYHNKFCIGNSINEYIIQ